MSKTFSELLEQANKIKENVLPGSNTAILLGQQLLEMVNKLQEENTERIKGTTEWNVSILCPIWGLKSDGGEGGNLYTQETAITAFKRLLTENPQLSEQLKTGQILSFFNTDNYLEKLKYTGTNPAILNNYERLLSNVDIERLCNLSFFKINGYGVNANVCNATNTGDIYYNITQKQYKICVFKRDEKYGGSIFLPLTLKDGAIACYNGIRYDAIKLAYNIDNNIGINNTERVLSTDFEKNNILNSSIFGKIVEGKSVLYNNGKIIDSSNFSYVIVDVEGKLAIEMLVPYQSGIVGVAFFDKDNNYISGIKYRVDEDYLNKSLYKLIAKIPTTAVTAKASILNAINRLQPNHYSTFSFCNNESEDDNVLTLCNDDICDFFVVNTEDGKLAAATSSACTSYIDIEGAVEIELTVCQFTTTATWGLAFFDKDKNFISSIPREKGTEIKSVIKKYTDIPALAKYMRTSFFNFENRKLYGDFKCTITFNDAVKKYRPYQNGYIFFSQKILQNVNKFWRTEESLENEVYKSTTSVLALPSTYTQDGKPTPIIMYCHGISHYVCMDKWGDLNTSPNFLVQKQHWLDAGYAVFDCNGARDNSKAGNFPSCGSPQFVEAYYKSYEYIKQNYNVEDKISVVAASAGGLVGFNFTLYHSNIVKSMATLSGWSSLIQAWNVGTSLRNLMKEYLGFEDITTYDKEKAIGYDPSLRIYTNSDNIEQMQFPVPIKGFIGSEEKSSALYTPFYRLLNAIRSAGNTAFIREITGLTHSDVTSGGNDVVDTEVIEWLNTFS